MNGRRQVALATAIAVLGALFGVAGTGHAYLREWRRAVAWFSLVLGAGIVLVTTFADPATATPATLPDEVTLPVVALLALNTFDAYRVARRSVTPNSGDGEEASCPHCGKPVDEDLAFCHWCTEPLDPEGHRGGDPEGR